MTCLLKMNQMVNKNLCKPQKSRPSGDQIFRLSAQLSINAWVLTWWRKEDFFFSEYSKRKVSRRCALSQKWIMKGLYISLWTRVLNELMFNVTSRFFRRTQSSLWGFFRCLRHRYLGCSVQATLTKGLQAPWSYCCGCWWWVWISEK